MLVSIGNIEKYFKDEYKMKIKIKMREKTKPWEMGEREIIITNKGAYIVYYLADGKIKSVYRMLKNGKIKAIKGFFIF